MRSNRAAVRSLSLLWPVGLLLVMLVTAIPSFSTPVFLVVDAVYVLAVVALLRRLDARSDALAAALVGIGVGIFAMVGFSGPPTADDPGMMTLNTGALFVIAVAILVVAVKLVLRYRSSAAAVAAVPGLVLLGMGTTVYLANLLSRVAVHLSGAAEQQAAVEDTAWVAFEYLRGLETAPDFMALMLVWQDLLQLGYVTTVYVCLAGLARLLRSQGAVSDRVGRLVQRTGIGLASVIVLGVTLAVALPREHDLVFAWAAFVASIPFMTTVLPFALGVGMLSVNADRGSARSAEKEMAAA